MAEFTFEIEEHLLTLSENEKGWTKEINRVSFNPKSFIPLSTRCNLQNP
ncbi:putative cytoplasmic protein [Streptococcus pneumoniae]|nr:hypothetical protein [Streptococcus pneumoniae]CON03847.1 putative cytoplasmic protein [Streptococcus pneumoniae]